MGFSQKPQDQIEKIGSLLDFTQTLKLLLDGKALEGAVKSFYALNESEKAAFDSANNIVTQADAIAEEQKKRKAALDAFHESLMADKKSHQEKIDSDSADLNAKEAANAVASLAIKNAQAALDVRVKDVDARSAQAELMIKQAQEMKRQADVDRANFGKSIDDLTAKWNDVHAYEAGLKSTAAALQKITDGL